MNLIEQHQRLELIMGLLTTATILSQDLQEINFNPHSIGQYLLSFPREEKINLPELIEVIAMCLDGELIELTDKLKFYE